MSRSTTLTSVAQDYLKVIWGAQEWSEEPVTTKLLSEKIGVGPSTVSETIRRLAAQGLVEHARYGAVALTDEGRRHALAMVRRHRLLETFLVNELGYRWDEVHNEAEILEHAVSDTMMERISAKLGDPVRDPHGDPIPRADGTMARPAAIPLSALEPGQEATVVRISDADPDLLRYISEIGIGLDVRVTVRERHTYAGTLVAEVVPPHTTVPAAQAERHLGLRAAEQVWVATASMTGS